MRYFVSFYPDENAEGGALRQNLVIDVARDHKDHRSLDKVLRAAKKKGQELKAQSFVIFQQTMPRVWRTEYDPCEDEDS